MPYLDLDLKYYDLGMEVCDETNYQITIDTAEAITPVSSGSKSLASKKYGARPMERSAIFWAALCSGRRSFPQTSPALCQDGRTQS